MSWDFKYQWNIPESIEASSCAFWNHPKGELTRHSQTVGGYFCLQPPSLLTVMRLEVQSGSQCLWAADGVQRRCDNCCQLTQLVSDNVTFRHFRLRFCRDIRATSTQSPRNDKNEAWGTLTQTDSIETTLTEADFLYFISVCSITETKLPTFIFSTFQIHDIKYIWFDNFSN